VHRYEELEKLYYKKKMFKIFLIVFFFILGIGYLLTYKILHFKEDNKTNKNFENKVSKENLLNESKKNENKNTTLKKEIDSEEKLSFILPEINDTKEKKLKISEKNKKIKTQNKIVEKPHIVVTPKIVIKEKKITINELKQKFSQNSSYDIAIIIAKEYYKRKNYKQAQIWAVKANTLDPERVESWILFADILLKENKKKKAIEVLKVYVDQYGEDERIKAKLRSINE
jgi:tetratricopeptide (TPR) repeat protein